MVSEVVDERTFIVRDAAAKSGRRKLVVRLGNVGQPKRGDRGDAEYQAKLERSRNAFEKLVGKQMIWWKAAADEHQPQAPEGGDKEEVPVLADVWLIDGRHVNGWLTKQGHLSAAEDYPPSELARDILTVEADANKKAAYANLEKAMKENQKAQKEAAAQAAKEAKEKADAEGEPIGVAGWIGIVAVGIIILGVFLLHHSGQKKKKVNFNRKRGWFESIWAKLKGE